MAVSYPLIAAMATTAMLVIILAALASFYAAVQASYYLPRVEANAEATRILDPVYELSVTVTIRSYSGLRPLTLERLIVETDLGTAVVELGPLGGSTSNPVPVSVSYEPGFNGTVHPGATYRLTVLIGRGATTPGNHYTIVIVMDSYTTSARYLAP